MNRDRQIVRSKLASRGNQGTILSVLAPVITLICFSIAALAVDVEKGIFVRSQLQVACDAAALSGAQALAKTGIIAGDTNTQTAISNATNVCASNYCEQVAISNQSPATVVNSSYALNVPYNNGTGNTVTVTCTHNMSTLFSRLLKWQSAPISATATAIAFHGVNQINTGGAVPIMVSLNFTPTSGSMKNIPLESLAQSGTAIGKTFTIVLNGNNANNGAWIKDWGNGSSNPNPVQVGDSLQATNGTITNLQNTLTIGNTYLLPIFLGTTPFNSAEPIVGFMGFQVSSIATTSDHSIGGTIVNVFVTGQDQAPAANGALDSNGIAFLNQTMPWQLELIR